MDLGNKLHIRICIKTVIEYFCKRWDLFEFILGMLKEITRDLIGNTRKNGE